MMRITVKRQATANENDISRDMSVKKTGSDRGNEITSDRGKGAYLNYAENRAETLKCSECTHRGELLISKTHGIYMCKECALALYKRLGNVFVPRALPNLVAKSVAARREADKQIR